MRLDCLIDVSVDAVGSKSCHQPVGVEDVKNLRLDPRQSERDAVRLRDLVELGQLRCSLRVDEIDAFEVEDERMQRRLTVPDDRADAIVERLGGGEEETAVEAQHGGAREGLVTRILVELAERLAARLAAEHGHPWRGCDIDEPAE